MKVAFHTLGCKTNQYDTEAMRELFRRAGHEPVDFEPGADVYIINTCTVTGEGDRKSRQMVGRARRLNPDAVVGVVGCYPQRAADEALGIEGVDFVAGTGRRGEIVALAEEHVRGAGRENAVADLADLPFEEIGVLAHEGRRRAYIKIQEGCRNFCTYCIIPTARGPLRSRPLASIRKEAAELVAAGFEEAVLTGIHIASYGKESGGNLLDAVYAVADSGMRRIRLGSLEPGLLDEEFCDKVAGIEAVCPHFHVSLQSGSDTVLERMGRRYRTALYRKNILNIRTRYDFCGITTDVMVGFPGETQEEFEQSLEFVEEIGFSRIHVFSYSPRQGTPAAEFCGQVERREKDRRNRTMQALGVKMERAYGQGALGQLREVLPETVLGDDAEGYTQDYIKVRLVGGADATGIVKARLQAVGQGYLWADMEGESAYAASFAGTKE
ncbi:MAG: tRNA (N(6)-L-threonylcarbamoyladenosine(37)-C(2))-methylthiotransferase MtaB [Christensenellales bacterium]|jgi:threonylcarbamoyladenosine tRNA methylthiotransferase MtaB